MNLSVPSIGETTAFQPTSWDFVRKLLTNLEFRKTAAASGKQTRTPQACAWSDAIDVPNWAMDIGQWLPEWLAYGMLAWLVYGSVMTLFNPHCMMRRCCRRSTIESLVDSEAVSLVPQTCQRA